MSGFKKNIPTGGLKKRKSVNFLKSDVLFSQAGRVIDLRKIDVEKRIDFRRPEQTSSKREKKAKTLRLTEGREEQKKIERIFKQKKPPFFYWPDGLEKIVTEKENIVLSNRDKLLEILAQIDRGEAKLKAELGRKLLNKDLRNLGETISNNDLENDIAIVAELEKELFLADDFLLQFLNKAETDEVDKWILEVEQEKQSSTPLINYDFTQDSQLFFSLDQKKSKKRKEGRPNLAEIFQSVDPKIFIRPKKQPRFWRFQNYFNNLGREVAKFAGAGVLIWLIIFGLSLAGQGFSAKENILSSALEAYRSMTSAKNLAVHFDFSGAEDNFGEAYQNFLNAQNELDKMGKVVISVLEKMPGVSIISSGSALLEVGENLVKAGQSFSRLANLFFIKDLSFNFSDTNQRQSLTEKIIKAKQEIEPAQKYLAKANEKLQAVVLADLPEEVRPAVSQLKEKLPLINKSLSQVNFWSDIFLEILGHQQAKKYLLIFQNTSEQRATGGFIGTYGLLDIDKGRIKNLQIDGIFNLDGQLYEKIVPPRPIQKISTAWSTHDANWFADWPTSAQKIMWFYEKAGGETVDGVFSLTPAVIERLLKITGPIDMPEYGVTLNSENFLDVTQYKVEFDYDKKLNQPKKILADFAPRFLDKLWEVWPSYYDKIIKIISDSLAEKHILFYFTNKDLENVFIEQGWGGEVLATEKDYLMVVNTNINGFKTDKVIKQDIIHQSQIEEDGSIIDTVKIIRTHFGGQEPYDWYNKVNADYLRVFVPLGSELLFAEGHTLEGYAPPVDYEKLGFHYDKHVEQQQSSMILDQKSGTQIFVESGKTVFGNWVYVSPGEKVEITYKYRLPFKINLKSDNITYSFLAQKQSGSNGCHLESFLQLPKKMNIVWYYPENLQISDDRIKFSAELNVDKFYGLVLGQ